MSTGENIFDIIILLARPGAGKSEVISFLKNQTETERRRLFHIGKMIEIDDFPMLWTWFEEDSILDRLGTPRLHTTPDGYFKDKVLWNVLIERISLEYEKIIRDFELDNHDFTVIIEFSRGTEHGGYEEAFRHLSSKILQKAAVLYLDVTFEESLRKNRRRFNPAKPDSILEHGLPDDKMERLYKESDWEFFSGKDSKYLLPEKEKVPYTVFPNHDDVTTPGGEPLKIRLTDQLNNLWEVYINRDT